MGPLSGFYKTIKDSLSTILPMSELKGVHAIDFSIFLYEGFHSNDDNLQLFHQLPKCDIPSIRTKILNFDANMKKYKLQYIMVMDGLSHPLKLASLKRLEITEHNKLLLQAALKDPNYYKKEMKDLMASTCILSRSDIYANCLSIFKEIDIK